VEAPARRPGDAVTPRRESLPRTAPKFVRARLYIYKFAPYGSGRWWDRTLVREWIPPLSVDDPRLLDALKAYGWL
jgi:hypothetical protein